MKEPQRPSDLLPDILKEFGSKASRVRFRDALEACLTETQFARCQVVGFRGGRLTVEVDSAPLYAELTGFRSEEIRAAMNEQIHPEKIAQIRFRLGSTRDV